MPNYKNVGYKGDTFYSYSTAIARVLKNKYGEYICLMSDNNFSTTTAKQLCHLKRACPFTVIYVPCEYGSYYIDMDQVITEIFDNLKYYSESKLTLKNNRQGFMNAYNQLTSLLDNFEITLKEDQKTVLGEYDNLFDTLNNSDAVKLIKAKQKEIDKQLRDQFKKLMQESNIVELAYLAYSRASTLTPEQKTKYRKQLNPFNSYSYVWLENGMYITSQGIRIEKREGDLLLKLFKQGKLKHGYKISHYTVISISKDIVKIGCHEIPTQNLYALCDLLENAA